LEAPPFGKDVDPLSGGDATRDVEEEGLVDAWVCVCVCVYIYMCVYFNERGGEKGEEAFHEERPLSVYI
jgi:hypothetical protein